MSAFTLFLIAIGLSMDAFAVAVTNGIAMRPVRVGGALAIAVSFGLFQALMPALGWMAGMGLRPLLEGCDHWIALLLLGGLGAKMLWDARLGKPADQTLIKLTLLALLGMSVATSIDALAVGFGLSSILASIAVPVVVIGVVTLVLSFCGVFIGHCCGALLQNKARVVGGLILLVIGVRIFIEHTC